MGGGGEGVEGGGRVYGYDQAVRVRSAFAFVHGDRCENTRLVFLSLIYTGNYQNKPGR